MKLKKSAIVKNAEYDAADLIEHGKCRKGDIVLVKLLSVNKFDYIVNPDGRKVTVKKGDMFVGALSDRYATRVLEGTVPEKLERGDVIHRLEPGGAIGLIKKCRKDFVKTELEFQGFLAQGRRVLNMMDFSVQVKRPKSCCSRLVISTGTDMSSGKTTAAAKLIEGLVRSGHKVGAGKITGIGNINDALMFKRSGAGEVYSIIDAGCPSTAGLSQKELETIFLKVFTNLASEGTEFIVIEIADGILQRETTMLLNSHVVKKHIPIFMLSCNDAPGAYGGLMVLKKMGIVPAIVSGMGAITELGRAEIEEVAGVKAFDSIAQRDEMSKFICSYAKNQ